MILNKLYDKFKNWYCKGKEKFGNIWIYADPHFGDDETNKLLRINYVGDMEQVNRINSKVGKYDTIVFLGDIGDIEYIRLIRGYKVLILGNHDQGYNNYKREICDLGDAEKYIECYGNKKNTRGFYIENDHMFYDNKLFDEVYDGMLMISSDIILSHEPLLIDFPYAVNIYGHTHKIDGNKCNVCAENINYTPVSLKKLIEEGICKNVIDIHRETIDNAIKNKKEGN